jgi:hypothetical protein
LTSDFVEGIAKHESLGGGIVVFDTQTYGLRSFFMGKSGMK